MHRFLGAINYLEKFCSQLSSVTQLQCNFSKEDMPILWSTRQQQAFDSAKVLATSVACLAYFDVTAPLILQLDTSDHGQGAALLQPIQPHSSSALDESSLRPTEKRYAQIEKECLAIVEALNIFEWWLLGKSNTESIQTTNPFSWSSRRTSPQRPNVCRECFFSYSVITLLLCPYIYIILLLQRTI